MPRRLAPTPLRLVQGPLPKRGEPKHTLPSLPRPVFHHPSRASQGPIPRERAQVFAPTADVAEDTGRRASVEQFAYPLPTGAVSPTPGWSSTSHGSSRSRGHSRQSSTSSINSTSSSRRNSWSSKDSARSSLDEENPNMVYGPWVKNVKSSALPFDPDTLIMPPRPAAINPVPVW
ncbi:hypothetical protein DAEQUDRAFT_295721 [Daedalea quercina L-15889]|uniref:Uncharacterized protein n=1 Tax=Daedalea quercina L-15889 TaxID=1314783 RepID=A0A165U0Z3_9APHY|nr:hypothetical protein DAEQUDRAFT_295721 [Daedalea quercina L-15889]